MIRTNAEGKIIYSIPYHFILKFKHEKWESKEVNFTYINKSEYPKEKSFHFNEESSFDCNNLVVIDSDLEFYQFSIHVGVKIEANIFGRLGEKFFLQSTFNSMQNFYIVSHEPSKVLTLVFRGTLNRIVA